MTNPIADFFASYHYPYEERMETMAQFRTMCTVFNWNRDSAEKKEALNRIRDAIAQRFNEHYGGDVESYETWRSFLLKLRVKESDIPDNVEDCKKKVKTIHVNICDLVDHSISRKRVRKFRTAKELAEYSRRNGKIYPKENAYAEGLLRFLLREIFNSYAGRGRVQGGSGRGRDRRRRLEL